jgi:hypothetical protein
MLLIVKITFARAIKCQKISDGTSAHQYRGLQVPVMNSLRIYKTLCNNNIIINNNSIRLKNNIILFSLPSPLS